MSSTENVLFCWSAVSSSVYDGIHFSLSGPVRADLQLGGMPTVYVMSGSSPRNIFCLVMNCSIASSSPSSRASLSSSKSVLCMRIVCVMFAVTSCAPSTPSAEAWGVGCWLSWRPATLAQVTSVPLGPPGTAVTLGGGTGVAQVTSSPEAPPPGTAVTQVGGSVGLDDGLLTGPPLMALLRARLDIFLSCLLLPPTSTPSVGRPREGAVVLPASAPSALASIIDCAVPKTASSAFGMVVSYAVQYVSGYILSATRICTLLPVLGEVTSSTSPGLALAGTRKSITSFAWGRSLPATIGGASDGPLSTRPLGVNDSSTRMFRVILYLPFVKSLGDSLSGM